MCNFLLGDDFRTWRLETSYLVVRNGQVAFSSDEASHFPWPDGGYVQQAAPAAEPPCDFCTRVLNPRCILFLGVELSCEAMNLVVSLRSKDVFYEADV